MFHYTINTTNEFDLEKFANEFFGQINVADFIRTNLVNFNNNIDSFIEIIPLINLDDILIEEIINLNNLRNYFLSKYPFIIKNSEVQVVYNLQYFSQFQEFLDFDKIKVFDVYKYKYKTDFNIPKISEDIIDKDINSFINNFLYKQKPNEIKIHIQEILNLLTVLKNNTLSSADEDFFLKLMKLELKQATEDIGLDFDFNGSLFKILHYLFYLEKREPLANKQRIDAYIDLFFDNFPNNHEKFSFYLFHRFDTIEDIAIILNNNKLELSIKDCNILLNNIRFDKVDNFTEKEQQLLLDIADKLYEKDYHLKNLFNKIQNKKFLKFLLEKDNEKFKKHYGFLCKFILKIKS